MADFLDNTILHIIYDEMHARISHSAGQICINVVQNGFRQYNRNCCFVRLVRQFADNMTLDCCCTFFPLPASRCQRTWNAIVFANVIVACTARTCILIKCAVYTIELYKHSPRAYMYGLTSVVCIYKSTFRIEEPPTLFQANLFV